MKKLYCLDFDGTITKKDTMFLFLKFYSPRKFYFEFLRHSPLFALLKFHLANTERVKRSFVSSILKGESQKKIEKAAQEFFAENYPGVIRQNALDFIQNLNRNNTQSVLVTASLDIWMKPFAQEFKMDLISTETLFEDGIFTGRFLTPNCNGTEKVKRLKKYTQGKSFDKTIAFGDTESDKPMMDWADESHYRFFH